MQCPWTEGVRQQLWTGFIEILKDERQIIAQYVPKLARRHMHGEEPVLR